MHFTLEVFLLSFIFKLPKLFQLLCVLKMSVHLNSVKITVMCAVLVVSDSLWPHGLLCYGILQARILDWVAIPVSRESFWPKGRTQISCIAGSFFTISAIRETQENGYTWFDSYYNICFLSYFSPIPFFPHFVLFIWIAFSFNV